MIQDSTKKVYSIGQKKMNYFKKMIILIFILHDVTEGYYELNSPPDTTFSWTQEIHVDYRQFDNLQPPTYDTLVSTNNHSFALLHCKIIEDGYFRNCSLTTRTHTFDGRIYSSECEIQPPSEEHNASAVLQGGITFLRHDRVLVSWKEEHRIQGWRMSSQVIFTDNCRSSYFIHVHTKMDEDSAVFEVFRFKNSFDIIFGEDESCIDDNYCKVTYDYDGNPLYSVPSSISTSLLSRNDKFTFGKAYPIVYNSSEGIILIGRIEGFPFGTKNIYSPLIGWLEAKNISYSENVYSNSSGFATLCWRPSRVPNQLTCKWLDGTHGNATLTFEFKPFFSKMPLIYNSPNGNIMLVNRGLDSQGMLNLFVDEVIRDVRCKRLVKVLFPAYADLVAISRSPHDQFCFSHLFKDWESFGNPSVVRYTLSTECVDIPNHNILKYRRCGSSFA